MNLQNQTIVIIGGSSGIGFATAKQAQSEGARVVIVSRSLARLQKAQERLGQEVEIKVADTQDAASLTAAFKAIGPFDHLQLPASEISFGFFAELSVMDAQAAFLSKFWGPYQAARLALPYLRSSGSITFYSGVYSQLPKSPGAPVVAAINSAIEGLARALAVELVPIRVNTITPGIVDTELFANLGMNEAERAAFFAKIAEHQVIKRASRPEEIAETALYLMRNTYSTGNTLFVDGGMTLR